jgi:cysteine-S-conjugate beta-lyase
MTYDFDALIDRRGSNCIKWSMYGGDVLPMWVADMDFRSPQPIIDALAQRVQEGVFGYEFDSPDLRETICERMETRYGWIVDPKQILLTPGLVTALGHICRTIGEPGDGVLFQPPVYPPFISAIKSARKELHAAQLVPVQHGAQIDYPFDPAAFEAAITPKTRLFMLCNPHNPTGRVYARAELEQMAEICQRHDLIICSDEIHSDLVYETLHTPIASISPEIAARTITMIAASKTFNIPGLFCGVMIVQDPDLHSKIMMAGYEHLLAHPNALGITAANAAYREGQPWLDELLPYLRANRDFIVQYVEQHLPGVLTTCPEGTYLAWLDFRALNLPEHAFDFFLKNAKVALTKGDDFGAGGEGFVRLNFGCPRSMLEEALERMRRALAEAV